MFFLIVSKSIYAAYAFFIDRLGGSGMIIFSVMANFLRSLKYVK